MIGFSQYSIKRNYIIAQCSMNQVVTVQRRLNKGKSNFQEINFVQVAIHYVEID